MNRKWFLQEDSGSEEDGDDEEALVQDCKDEDVEPGGAVLVVPKILMTLDTDDQDEEESTAQQEVLEVTGLGQLSVPMVKVRKPGSQTVTENIRCRNGWMPYYT